MLGLLLFCRGHSNFTFFRCRRSSSYTPRHARCCASRLASRVYCVASREGEGPTPSRTCLWRTCTRWARIIPSSGNQSATPIAALRVQVLAGSFLPSYVRSSCSSLTGATYQLTMAAPSLALEATGYSRQLPSTTTAVRPPRACAITVTASAMCVHWNSLLVGPCIPLQSRLSTLVAASFWCRALLCNTTQYPRRDRRPSARDAARSAAIRAGQVSGTRCVRYISARGPLCCGRRARAARRTHSLHVWGH